MIGIYISVTALAIGYAINSYQIYKLKGSKVNRYRIQVGKVVMFLHAASMHDLIATLRIAGVKGSLLIRKATEKEWR